MPAQPPASICILRLSAIGDCCHVVALVQYLQKHLPNAQITWVIGKLEAQLMRPLLPSVNLVEFDKNLGIKAYFKLSKQLKYTKFDYLLHLQPNMRANLASLAIKAKTKIGYHKSRTRELQSWFVNQQAPLGEGIHVAESFMDFATALGLPVAKPSWQISAPEADLAWAKEFITDKPLLVVCPAASKAEKNWHAQGYAEVINHAYNQGMQVILVGSPAKIEIDLARQVEKLAPEITYNLVGKTSLPKLLALIQIAQLVIAPDTGPAHMATLVGTPVIGLYATHNPQRTGPYNDLDKVVSVYEQALLEETGKTPAEVSWRTRVKMKDAMAKINAKEVISNIDNYLIFKEI